MAGLDYTMKPEKINYFYPAAWVVADSDYQLHDLMFRIEENLFAWWLPEKNS